MSLSVQNKSRHGLRPSEKGFLYLYRLSLKHNVHSVTLSLSLCLLTVFLISPCVPRSHAIVSTILLQSFRVPAAQCLFLYGAASPLSHPPSVLLICTSILDNMNSLTSLSSDFPSLLRLRRLLLICFTAKNLHLKLCIFEL